PVAELSLNAYMLLGMGLAIGVLSGMFGIGGGFILTPFLFFLGVPPGVAVRPGPRQGGAAAVSSAGGPLPRGQGGLHMGILLVVGGFLGAVVGVKVLYWLRVWGQLDLMVALTYVVLLGVVGVLMLIESVKTLRASPAKLQSASHRGGQHGWIERLPLNHPF